MLPNRAEAHTQVTEELGGRVEQPQQACEGCDQRLLLQLSEQRLEDPAELFSEVGLDDGEHVSFHAGRGTRESKAPSDGGQEQQQNGNDRHQREVNHRAGEVARAVALVLLPGRAQQACHAASLMRVASRINPEEWFGRVGSRGSALRMRLENADASSSGAVVSWIRERARNSSNGSAVFNSPAA